MQITAFQQRLLFFQPQTRAQEVLHALTLDQFNVYLDLRHQRLYSVTTGLPVVLWVVVVIGAVLNLALTWLFAIERLSVHLAVAGSLALFIGLQVFLIAAMDNPIRGDFSVTPEPFEILQGRLAAPTRMP